MGTSAKKFRSRNFWLQSVSRAATEKKYRSSVHSILMPPTLHIAHLNQYPKVFRGRPEFDLVSTVWPSQVRKPRFVQRKIGYFEVCSFYETIFLDKLSIFAKSRYIFPESYCSKDQFRIIWDPLSAPSDPPNFLAHRDLEVATLAETLSYTLG